MKHTKLRIIPILLTAFLTACGGGGGSPPAPAAIVASTAPTLLGAVGFNSNYGLVPAMASGDFKGDGSRYVVIAGWLSSSQNVARNPSPEVRVFKVNADGTGSDATVEILGGLVNASVNYPLIADFNGDGIDDIFLPGFTDAPAQDANPSIVFLSSRGGAHTQVAVPGAAWNHGAVSVDIDGNGTIDVVNSNGQMWLNDGRGNFTFKDHSWTSTPPFWMHGSGVCSGDFNNSGKPQLVITDHYIDSNAGPIVDTAIFELNANLEPVASHYLPVPYFDRGADPITGNEISHDVSCIVADLNNDGKLDIVMVSALNSADVRAGTAPHQSVVQIYLNQGNFVFTDVTDSATSQPNKAFLSTYTPRLLDFNGDGKLDLWLTSSDNQSINSNQLWLNNGAGVYTQSASSIINKAQADFSALVGGNAIGGAGNTTYGMMLPVKVGSNWVLVTTSFMSGQLKVGAVKWQ